MKTLIMQLETIGQSSSMKQHASAKELIESGQHDLDLIEQVFNNSHELICMVEPEDDQE